jgi:A/G-specific adenine glycosylase
MKKLDSNKIEAFQKKIWHFFSIHNRLFPWRETENSYAILVSEIMLQQTQTERVIPKYEEFLSAFPTFKKLARAPFNEVLKIWNGLGYNRRAKAVHECAKIVVDKYKGILPSREEDILQLPGVGEYTCNALQAFVYHRPVIVLETNIRTVYLHEWFQRTRRKIHDKEIKQLIAQTLSPDNPREWYYALMDYGASIKTQYPDINSKSFHYKKQSPFKGSIREIRGKVLKHLLHYEVLTVEQLSVYIKDGRVSEVIRSMEREDLIKRDRNGYTIA